MPCNKSINGRACSEAPYPLAIKKKRALGPLLVAGRRRFWFLLLRPELRVVLRLE